MYDLNLFLILLLACQVNEAGSHIVAAESGDLLYWDMGTQKVVHQEKQEHIQQIFFYKSQSRCVVVSKKGSKGNESGLCVSRSVKPVQNQNEKQLNSLSVQVCTRGNQTVGVRVSFRYIHQGETRIENHTEHFF